MTNRKPLIIGTVVLCALLIVAGAYWLLGGSKSVKKLNQPTNLLTEEEAKLSPEEQYKLLEERQILGALKNMPGMEKALANPEQRQDLLLNLSKIQLAEGLLTSEQSEALSKLNLNLEVAAQARMGQLPLMDMLFKLSNDGVPDKALTAHAQFAGDGMLLELPGFLDKTLVFKERYKALLAQAGSTPSSADPKALLTCTEGLLQTYLEHVSKVEELPEQEIHLAGRTGKAKALKATVEAKEVPKLLEALLDKLESDAFAKDILAQEQTAESVKKAREALQTERAKYERELTRVIYADESLQGSRTELAGESKQAFVFSDLLLKDEAGTVRELLLQNAKDYDNPVSFLMTESTDKKSMQLELKHGPETYLKGEMKDYNLEKRVAEAFPDLGQLSLDIQNPKDVTAKLAHVEINTSSEGDSLVYQLLLRPATYPEMRCQLKLGAKTSAKLEAALTPPAEAMLDPTDEELGALLQDMSLLGKLMTLASELGLSVFMQ